MTGLPSLGPRGEGWFVLQLLLLAAVVGGGLLFGPLLDGAARFAAALAGLALIVAGLGLALAGISHLGRAASPLPRPTAGGALVEHGVYRLIRHPIYVGVLASALGWALLMASLAALLAVALLALLLDLKARREEAWLSERYPEYAAYVRRTRRFVPGMY